MALIKCPECGKDISDTAVACPNCGYPIARMNPAQQQQGQGNINPMAVPTSKPQGNPMSVPVSKPQGNTQMSGSSSAQQNIPVPKKPKKKIKGKTIAWIIGILFVLGIIGNLMGGDDDTKETETQQEQTTDATSEQTQEQQPQEQTEQPQEEKAEFTRWKNAYGKKKINYVNMKYLYNHMKQYDKKIVLTEGTVEQVDDKLLQFHTKKDTLMFEVEADCVEDISSIKNGEDVVLVGKASAEKILSKEYITINDTYIVATGTETGKWERKIKKASKKQKKVVENTKKKQKKKKAKKAANNKNAYIRKCKTLPYKSIKRNPNRYKGKYAKVSGKVDQVIEGWFDGVTIYINDSSGNKWEISYTYSKNESKILENDRITVYGKCGGTETSTTLLGKQVVIPAVDAEYISR